MTRLWLNLWQAAAHAPHKRADAPQHVGGHGAGHQRHAAHAHGCRWRLLAGVWRVREAG